jgi:pimeloyl-ACP methyl ester carboxylesterase
MVRGSQGSLGIVYVSGAGLDGWIWKDLAEKTTYPWLTIDLPGRGNNLDILTGKLSLAEYVDLAALQVERFEVERIVLVSHSIGTSIALELAGRLERRVGGIVVISSSIPKAGQSYASLLPFPVSLILPILLRIVGTRPPESAIRDTMCEGVAPEDASRIVSGFVPESLRLYTDKLADPRLPDKRLYVETTSDKAFPIKLQRNASKLFDESSIRRLDTGHLPMLTRTDDLSKIVGEFVDSI